VSFNARHSGGGGIAVLRRKAFVPELSPASFRLNLRGETRPFRLHEAAPRPSRGGPAYVSPGGNSPLASTGRLRFLSRQRPMGSKFFPGRSRGGSTSLMAGGALPALQKKSGDVYRGLAKGEGHPFFFSAVVP